VDSAKYLGVEITEKLNWGKHVHSIAAKANQTSAFVYRKLKGCPTTVQSRCFKGLLRPVLEYASLVWDPFQQNLSDALELVQHRVARRILHEFSPRTSASALVRQLDLQTLSERRSFSFSFSSIDKVAMLYKIINDQVDILAAVHLKPAARTTRGQQAKIQEPQS
jgi:hypothetical protein